MKLTATEVLDWLERAATWSGLYLAWRWRPQGRDRQPGGRHHVLKLSDSVSVTDSLSVRGTGPRRITVGPAEEHDTALPIRVIGGAQAVLDSMAETFPYEFPPN
jgi:hypothetical protein